MGGQMIGIWETGIKSCQVPRNRGASNTDRSTWPSAVDNADNCSCCDACIEEIHHLLNVAASSVYPDIWAAKPSSKVGSLILSLNGDCGWGKDWINPGGKFPKCRGKYAYNDKTCGTSCRIIEGVYWASVTWIGGLYTTERAYFAGNEWLMTVPDAGMTALPQNTKMLSHYKKVRQSCTILSLTQLVQATCGSLELYLMENILLKRNKV